MPGGHVRRRSRGSSSGGGGPASVLSTSTGSQTTHNVSKRTGKKSELSYYWTRLKDYLNRSLEEDTALLVKIQQFECLPLTILARIGAFLGGEAGHIIAMGLCVFCISPRFGVVYGTMLALSLSCGNILKNIFCMPRPASPPVRALDNEHDWGMPSTHTINAITLGGLVMWTMFKINLTLNAQLYFLLGLMIWTFMVVGSRLYLGVHSIIDVKVGAVVGLALLFGFVPLSETYVEWVFNDIWAPITFGLCCAAVLYFHPQPYPTTSLYTSATILGMLYGLVVPCSIFWLTPFESIDKVSWHVTLLRFIGAAVILLSAKIIVKPIVVLLARYTLKAFMIPYYQGDVAQIEAQPSFSHVGVLEQLLEHRRRVQLAELLHTPVDHPAQDPELLKQHAANIELIFRPRNGVNLDVVTKFITYGTLGVIGICGPSLMAQYNLPFYSASA